MVKVKYFAYGSNMNRERLESRVGRVEVLGTGRLLGYDYRFDAGHPEFTPSSYVNIVKTGGDTFVEGVIYVLTKDQMKILDKFEAAPWAYNRIYESIGRHNVITYISINESYRRNISISSEYIYHLTKGAKDFGLKYALKTFESVRKFVQKF